MKKWLVDFEVISYITIAKGQNEVFDFVAPDNSYSAQIRNLKTKQGTPEPLLNIQIILDAEDWESAYNKSIDHLLKFLDCMALTLNAVFKRHRTRRVIDWTPGRKERECILFQTFANPNCPQQLINNEHLKSVSLFLQCDRDESLGLAMRWYRRALISDMPEEAFQYFWFALEILAEREKPAGLVSDKCHRCREPLFCKKCNEIPKHHPYPKQAIQALIKSSVRGNPDKFFEMVQKVRHALLHGESSHRIEKDIKTDFGKIRDLIGKVVWTALFNQLRKNLKDTKDVDKFCILQQMSYDNYEVGLTVDMLVFAPENSDINNPKIDDFPYPPVNVTMLVRESMDSVVEEEHKPLE